VKEEVEGINRTNEIWRVATARVHVVVSDRSVREIWVGAFSYRCNFFKVTASFVEKVEGWALDIPSTFATLPLAPMLSLIR